MARDPNDQIHGALFWIDRKEKPDLDRAEGLGYGYSEATLDVVTIDGLERALAYVASAGATDPQRQPYHWYKRLVVAGGIQRDLPAGYIASIRAVQSQDDPVADRDSKMAAEDALRRSGIVV
jgi:hypothetical protein